MCFALCTYLYLLPVPTLLYTCGTDLKLGSSVGHLVPVLHPGYVADGVEDIFHHSPGVSCSLATPSSDVLVPSSPLTRYRLFQPTPGTLDSFVV